MNIPIPLLNKKKCTIKLLSIIVGTLFWFIFSYDKVTTVCYTIPVIIYNDSAYSFDGPDTISIQLSGKRADFIHCQQKNLALYIDAHTLTPGKNMIEVTNQRLFLPSCLCVVDSSPNNSIITCKTM